MGALAADRVARRRLSVDAGDPTVAGAANVEEEFVRTGMRIFGEPQIHELILLLERQPIGQGPTRSFLLLLLLDHHLIGAFDLRPSFIRKQEARRAAQDSETKTDACKNSCRIRWIQMPHNARPSPARRQCRHKCQCRCRSHARESVWKWKPHPIIVRRLGAKDGCSLETVSLSNNALSDPSTKTTGLMKALAFTSSLIFCFTSFSIALDQGF